MALFSLNDIFNIVNDMVMELYIFKHYDGLLKINKSSQLYKVNILGSNCHYYLTNHAMNNDYEYNSHPLIVEYLYFILLVLIFDRVSHHLMLKTSSVKMLSIIFCLFNNMLKILIVRMQNIF